MRAGALMCAAALFAGCTDLRVIPTEDQAEIPEAPVRINGLTMRSYVGANLSQQIQARQADLYLNAQSTNLTNLTMDFYEGEQLVSTLQADYGVADLANEDFHADGRSQRIKITREDRNATLYATTLNYEPADDRLYTHGDFVILQFFSDGTAQVTRGNGVTTDARLNRFEFRRPRITTLPSVDIEEFERDVRPLNQENLS